MKEATELAKGFEAVGGAWDLAERARQLAIDAQKRGILTVNPSYRHLGLRPLLEEGIGIVTLTIGGKSKEELLRELHERGVIIELDAESVVESPRFTTLQQTQEIQLAIMPVRELVPFPKDDKATTLEIEAARDERGLASVPSEAALYYILQHSASVKRHAIWMNMHPIDTKMFDGRNYPAVLGVVLDGREIRLQALGTDFSSRWMPQDLVVFSVPQVARAA